ncbi:aminoglycoside N(3)-acetyltransferase [Kitasatospora sp. NBC_01539]|uniref:aminoglycoside N(3)-acetyltransferase n=1 Tax=Kitasatospora sp. NBC_01539 TaxID=2903577 RepID=UPI003860218A
MYSQAELTDHLRLLGIREGETLLVQASARAVGPVEDRARTVVAALRTALGGTGTLVAYTATPENSATSLLHRRATAGLTPRELRRHLATMLPYDPATTPASPTMGRISEEIRLLPGAVRSAHPQTSFSAVGPRAEALMAGHALGSHLGDRSPLQRLYAAGARVLLVSVPWSCCTVFHLAEYWQPNCPVQRYASVVTDRTGRRTWVHFEAPSLETRHFERMAADITADLPGLVGGRLGDAPCLLMPIADSVDLANKWLLNQEC